MRRMISTKQFTEGGLMPRFLLSVSSDPIPFIEPDAPAPDSEVQARWSKLCTDLLRQYRLSNADYRASMMPDALTEYVNFANSLIACMNDGMVDVQSYVARWCEISFRVALILHMAKHGDKAHDVKINLQTAKDAKEIIQYYASVQMQLLAPKTEDDQFARATKLYRTLMERYGGSAATRTIERSRGYSAEEIKKLAAKFPNLLKLDEIPTVSAGTPKKILSAVNAP
jgi:hypothetical protein